ncbi:MAG: hypothetical protein LBG47_08880 [Prevotellaceae bacterium]|jgi:hypothetical protein|nr:hypothetical protein [Prevotellaceae bacterium]
MKTKILKTIAAMLIVAAAGFSCKKDKSCSCGEGNGDSKPALEGTKWKLAGIMDAETCDLKELEPKDCSTCYTLEFDTDSTAWGKAAIRQIRLELLPKLFMTAPTFEGLNEAGDVLLFYDAMKTLTDYAATENEIKFCYNGGKNYLLFRKI